MGAGSTCDDCNANDVPDACEERLRACCLPAGQCVLWTAECCSAVEGIYFPTKKFCTDVWCAMGAPTPDP